MTSNSLIDKPTQARLDLPLEEFPLGNSSSGSFPIVTHPDLLVEIIIFLIAIAQAVELELVGRIYVAELLLALLLPYLLIYRLHRLRPLLGLSLIVVWTGWLGAQVLSDVLNESDGPDRLRGLAKILFVAVDVVAPLLLVDGRPRRIVAFGLGLALGTTLAVAQDPLYAQNFEVTWKFGLGRSVFWTILLVLALTQKRQDQASVTLVGLVAITGLFSVAIGSRSLGLFALATAGYMVLERFRDQGRIGAARSVSVHASLGALVVFELLAAVLAWQTYELAAERGWLSESQQIKRELQESGQFGTLVGSRPEFLVSWKAIAESPLLGHGSWARDQVYADEKALLLYRLGYHKIFMTPTNDLIPTHSLILGSWVEAGVAGAIFWSVVFVIGLRVILRLYRVPTRLSAYGFFVTIWLLWDCLFSPLGATSRLPTCWSLAVALMILRAAALPSAGQQAHPSTPVTKLP